MSFVWPCFWVLKFPLPLFSKPFLPFFSSSSISPDLPHPFPTTSSWLYSSPASHSSFQAFFLDLFFFFVWYVLFPFCFFLFLWVHVCWMFACFRISLDDSLGCLVYVRTDYDDFIRCILSLMSCTSACVHLLYRL